MSLNVSPGAAHRSRAYTRWRRYRRARPSQSGCTRDPYRTSSSDTGLGNRTTQLETQIITQGVEMDNLFGLMDNNNCDKFACVLILLKWDFISAVGTWSKSCMNKSWAVGTSLSWTWHDFVTHLSSFYRLSSKVHSITIQISGLMDNNAKLITCSLLLSSLIKQITLGPSNTLRD